MKQGEVYGEERSHSQEEDILEARERNSKHIRINRTLEVKWLILYKMCSKRIDFPLKKR